MIPSHPLTAVSSADSSLPIPCAGYIETINSSALLVRNVSHCNNAVVNFWQAGEEGFEHLVEEQTPGGMNEQAV